MGQSTTSRQGNWSAKRPLKRSGTLSRHILGAIGDPRVKPGVLEKGVSLTMRFYFDQYVNLRPVKLLEGIWTPLRIRPPRTSILWWFARILRIFYIGIGGRARQGKSHADFEIKRKLYNIKFGLDIDTDSEEIGYQIGEVSKEGS